MPEEQTDISESLDKVTEGFWARLNHPVFGVFIASWLVCNWEVVYLLIRGLDSTQNTITEINDHYLALFSSWGGFWRLVLTPLLTTLFYLFVGPYFKKIVNVHRTKVETEEKFEQSKARMELPVTGTEYEKLRAQAAQFQEQIRRQQEVMAQTSTNFQNQLQKEKDEVTILKEALSFKDGTVTVRDGASQTNVRIDDFLRKYYANLNQIKNLQRENAELRAAKIQDGTEKA